VTNTQHSQLLFSHALVQQLHSVDCLIDVTNVL